MQLSYTYKTTITFSESISFHHFLLRCSPNNYSFQQIISQSCIVHPHTNLSVGRDNFGNLLYSGQISEPHNIFEFEATGVVLLTDYQMAEELNRMYLYPSSYTQPTSNIVALFGRINFPPSTTLLGRIMSMSQTIQETVRYLPGVTNVHTTASESVEMGVGVCQDFAHILISCCRLDGIPARYVAGFMLGEGFTHAWVEFYDQGVWYGYDPTHDRKIEDGYIKVAHGRDYGDCAIDKGVFSGLSQQKLDVFLKVEQEQ